MAKIILNFLSQSGFTAKVFQIEGGTVIRTHCENKFKGRPLNYHSRLDTEYDPELWVYAYCY